MLDLDLGAVALALRARLRALIDAEVPADFLTAFTSDPAGLATAQRFCKILAHERLLTLAWPTEYGGGGGSEWEQTVFREEMWAHHEPRGAQYMGLNWVGPAIMSHGSDMQKAQHLPLISSGEVIWCQGFSESEAGTDLASLRTSAIRDGGGWRISGHKIWTSYASMAQWCFLLARTNRGTKAQDGISIFLVPMSSRGIELRPIDSLFGPHHLNEVYFDDVVVEADSVLGPVDKGWHVVQEALAFERIGIARYARAERLLQAAREHLRDQWESLPIAARIRWAHALLSARRARLLAYRAISLRDDGRGLRPADAAAYRVAVTQADQETGEALMELLGDAAIAITDPAAMFQRAAEDHWRYSQASTVASGSIEVQRMLLARSLSSRP